MEAPGHDRESLNRRFGVLGPRPLVFIGMALIALALLAAFTFVTLNAQSQARHQSERQFAAEATITARLTAALFSSSVTAAQQQAEKEYAGDLSSARLDASVSKGHLAYAAVLDGRGHLLAASSGAPTGAAYDSGNDAVRHAVAGTPWLSDVRAVSAGARVVEWAIPFSAASGRRVLVEGFDVSVLSGFLSKTLAYDQDRARIGMVVDDTGTVIASSNAHRSDPGAIADAGSGSYTQSGVSRYFTSAPVNGASWRVVLSEPTAQLYPALASSRAALLFIVIAAFGVASVGSLLFFRRALIGEARLAAKNAELVATNNSLEQQVAERTAASEERARQLAQSNSELEQFASVASHDLQEPLRKIRMFCDRLMKRLGDDLPQESASDARRIQDAAARMQRLIDDLLAFARVSNQDREFQPVDLTQVTLEVLDDLEARVAELNADVHIDQLPVIDGDPLQLRQLMQNLLSNALKFHRPDRRPTVRVYSQVDEASTARSSAETAMPERCTIIVEDNGIGFDKQYAERIFATFERLHSRAEYEGTGIGLSIARKIAWRHRGDLSATGRPGEGATFILTLPISHEDASAKVLTHA